MEYLFTGLNDIKPGMVEEATTKAREVALKFAADSQSRLGKIKSAGQGQFSIQNRDRHNPHIKKIRVVSTVEYYLSDEGRRRAVRALRRLRTGVTLPVEHGPEKEKRRREP